MIMLFLRAEEVDRLEFVKAHNPGYTKTDGTVVPPFEDSRPAAQTWVNPGHALASALSGATPAAGVTTVKRYHVTTKANAAAILQHGFDLTKVKPRWQNDYAVSTSPGLKRAKAYFTQRDKPFNAAKYSVLEVTIKGREFPESGEAAPGGSSQDYTRDVVKQGYDFAHRGATYVYNPRAIVSIKDVSEPAAPVLMLKARNKGYTKKDGTVVNPFYDSRKPADAKLPTGAKKNKVVVTVKPKGKNVLEGDTGAFLAKMQADWLAKKKAGAAVPAKSPIEAAEDAAAAAPPAVEDVTTDDMDVGSAKGSGAQYGFGWPSSKGDTGSLFGGWFGGQKGSAHKAPSYPNALPHPKVNDDDKPVQINWPSTPSAPGSWDNAEDLAQVTATDASSLPAALHGVPFALWSDHPLTVDGWDYVDGQMEDLDEPAMVLKGGKEPAAGVVIEEPDGRVWVVKPTNAWAGYRCTFPKGHTEVGLSLQATAIKECWEESGLKVKITGLLGDVERGQTITRYYRAERVGGTPADMGWESQAVALVPKAQLIEQLNAPVDHPIALAIGATPVGEDIDNWKQVGPQKGSNPGGLYEAPDGARWYAKKSKSASRAKNEVLASKLYEAAGVRAPECKLIVMDGQIGVASRIIPALKKDPQKLAAGAPGVRDGFAVDAWLANWDVVGLGADNLLLDPAGRAVRVDTGGALLYRAQGAPKGKAFGDTVGELETLRSSKINYDSARVFAKVSKADVVAGVARIAAIPDDKIVALCQDYGPGNPRDRASLAETLIARKHDLMERFPP